VGFALDGTDESAKVVRAESETRVSLATYSLEARILGSWLLHNSATLRPHLFGGLTANYFISGHLEQREELLSPSSAVFEDTRTSSRLVYAESVTSRLRPWTTFCAGAGMTPVTAEHFDVRARLSAEVPITAIVSELGQGLSYGFIRLDVSLLLKSPQRAPVPAPVPPVIRERTLAAELRLKARTEVNTMSDTAVIDITQALGTRVYSLLPFIFFSSGSDIIDARYNRLTANETSTYKPTTSIVLADTAAVFDRKATLELYYNLLNIVGRRMRVEFPEATLFIKGYVDNQGPERSNTQLSLRRAHSVRRYLHDVWQIDTSRLVVSSGLLSPTAASTTMSDERDRIDGHEENRRIELESSIPEVLDPVVITDSLVSYKSPRIVAMPSIISDSTDHQWQILTPCQSPTNTLALTGLGSPLPQYELDSIQCRVLGGIEQSAINSTLRVTAHDGRRAEAFASLPVVVKRQKVLLRRADGEPIQYRFRLTQFQYNNQRMLSAQSSIIQRYITPLLPDNASIRIYGYTDRKGPSDLNMQLALDRVKEIRSAFPSNASVTTLAVGEGSEALPTPFDNTMPEGRLYNRTVEVRVLIPATSDK
jgi:outer membrane protein OmpA-like peptidoglycan-associated protein